MTPRRGINADRGQQQDHDAREERPLRHAAGQRVVPPRGTARVRAEIVGGGRAVVRHRRDLAIAEACRTVGARERPREGEREGSGDDGRPQHPPQRRALEQTEKHRQRHGIHREEDRVVHRGVELRGGQQTERHGISRARAGHESMQRQQRERHAVRHLQLEMAVVLETVGVEPEQQAGDERRRSRPRQALGQEVHRERRGDEAQNHDQVVGHDRVHAHAPATVPSSAPAGASSRSRSASADAGRTRSG